MDRLDMESVDITDENIEKIGHLFPNVIVESEKGKSIDFDMLKQELSRDIVEGNKERYQLTWPGKKEAILTANTPTTKTLRPVREKSVDFDNTQNIYIEGDNLEALKILQESYLNKVKCIYIDPPYNTGNDFVYNDNFKKNEIQELKESGQLDDEDNELIANNQSNGRFHSDWLSMIYPRLKLARNLLSDDGVIFISIDENEVSNLKKICDEIFGEKNFVSVCPRKTRGSATTKSESEIQVLNDYILIYFKNKFIGKFNLKIKGQKKYPYSDSYGKYYTVPLQDNGPSGTRTARPNLYYPIYYNNGKLSLEKKSDLDLVILPDKHKNDDGRWMWSKDKFINDNKDLCVKDNKIYIKHYFNPNEDQNIYEQERNWLENMPNSHGTKTLNDVFNFRGLFSNPKPVEMIKMFLNMACDEKSIILDFFSGSATTAHAVMELNAEDCGHRKYIMIQLPENLEENYSKSSKEGKQQINIQLEFLKANDLQLFLTEIGEERIRRAGKKIKEETNANIDYGFRVFKIDSSNMNDVYYKPIDLSQSQLNMFESNIKEDRTPEDLLTQVMLDLGLPLDLKVEEKQILNNKVYLVDNNSLVACFDDIVNIDIVNEIAKIKPLKVVFKDSSFENDSDKINLQERFKTLSSETEISIL